MQRIDVPAFKGMAPKVSPALLEPTQGVSVTGTVVSGELRPWRIPAFVELCPPDTESIYLTEQGEWLAWNEVVNVHPAVQANDAFGRLYYTRESGGLYVISPLDDWVELRVGVPKPPSPPTVAVTGSGSGTVEDRVYVYTYVNDWGEEGPPSDPSEFVEYQPGQTLTVSGFAPPPVGFKLAVTVRIYRIAAGNNEADWFFVDEISTAVSEYVDAKGDIDLGEAMSTAEYGLPPENGRGLVPLANGIFAVFEGNEISFSEPYLPYSWPDAFRLTVAGSIVALGVSGMALVVLTTGTPYYVYTTHPSIPKLSPEDFGQSRLAEITPCVSPRSVVSTEFGVIFAAPDGLRVLQGEGPSKLATEALVGTDEWVTFFDPVNIRGVYYDATYFGFIPGQGFAYTPRLDILTWMGSGVRAMHSDGLSLFVVIGDGIYQWNADVGLLRGGFRSKVFRFDKPVNFSTLRVDSSLPALFSLLRDMEAHVKEVNRTRTRVPLDLAGEVLLGQGVAGDNLRGHPWSGGDLGWHEVWVWADGEERFYGKIDEQGFARLPAGFLAREWQFEIRTFSQVKQITMGTSTGAVARGR